MKLIELVVSYDIYEIKIERVANNYARVYVNDMYFANEFGPNGDLTDDFSNELSDVVKKIGGFTVDSWSKKILKYIDFDDSKIPNDATIRIEDVKMPFHRSYTYEEAGRTVHHEGLIKRLDFWTALKDEWNEKYLKPNE